MGRGTGASTVKLYYRIGEVAGIVGVEPHVLRYWETEFPSIRPQKSRSGQRVYSRRDVDKLLRVKELLYAQRFTIAGARQRLRDSASDVTVAPVEADVSVSVSPVLGTISPTAQTIPDGRSSAAQSLRMTLLSVRSDVGRLLEGINNRNSAAQALVSPGASGNIDADAFESTDSSLGVKYDNSAVLEVAEVVHSGGVVVIAKGEYSR